MDWVDLDILEDALKKINEKQKKETFLKKESFSSHLSCARSQFDFCVHLQPCYG